jgi:hypothetical protein
MEYALSLVPPAATLSKRSICGVDRGESCDCCDVNQGAMDDLLAIPKCITVFGNQSCGIATPDAIVVPMRAANSSPSSGWTPSSAASAAVSIRHAANQTGRRMDHVSMSDDAR